MLRLTLSRLQNKNWTQLWLLTILPPTFISREYSIEAQNMSGGLNATSGIENLAPEQQSAAENVRYSDEGGIQPRNGVVLLTASGGGAKVGNIHTHRNTVMFAKSGTKIYQSTDWKKHSYTTGVTRTATEIDEFESVERDVFASNQTDAY